MFLDEFRSILRLLARDRQSEKTGKRSFADANSHRIITALQYSTPVVHPSTIGPPALKQYTDRRSGRRSARLLLRLPTTPSACSLTATSIFSIAGKDIPSPDHSCSVRLCSTQIYDDSSVNLISLDWVIGSSPPPTKHIFPRLGIFRLL